MLAPDATPRAVNFGPDPASFCRVQRSGRCVQRALRGKPGGSAIAAAHPREAHALTLSSGLAERALGWRPRVSASAKRWRGRADWYRAYAAGEDMLRFSEAQIALSISASSGRKPMKCVILAGGKGTRIAEESSTRPKPMLEIGGRPILWHIMKLYAAFGVTRIHRLPRLQGLRRQGVLRELLPASGRRDVRHGRQPCRVPRLPQRALEGHAGGHRRGDA